MNKEFTDFEKAKQLLLQNAKCMKNICRILHFFSHESLGIIHLLRKAI